MDNNNLNQQPNINNLGTVTLPPEQPQNLNNMGTVNLPPQPNLNTPKKKSPIIPIIGIIAVIAVGTALILGLGDKKQENKNDTPKDNNVKTTNVNNKTTTSNTNLKPNISTTKAPEKYDATGKTIENGYKYYAYANSYILEIYAPEVGEKINYSLKENGRTVTLVIGKIEKNNISFDLYIDNIFITNTLYPYYSESLTEIELIGYDKAMLYFEEHTLNNYSKTFELFTLTANNELKSYYEFEDKKGLNIRNYIGTYEGMSLTITRNIPTTAVYYYEDIEFNICDEKPNNFDENLTATLDYTLAYDKATDKFSFIEKDSRSVKDDLRIEEYCEE